MTLVIDAQITDHSTVVLGLECNELKYKPLKTKTKIDYQAVKDDIESYDFGSILQSSDANKAAELLVSGLNSIITKHSTIVKVPRKKQIIKPWMTPGLLRCIRNRDSMHKKVKKEPTNLVLDTTYKRYRNFCTNLLRKLKTLHERNELKKSKTNPKSLWTKLKEISYTKKISSSSTALLQTAGTPELAVNSVNAYFAQIGQNLANKIKPLNQTQQKLPASSPNSLAMLEVTASDILGIINSLRDDCAVGWDGISSKILKLNANALVPTITHICNLSVSSGVFPAVFKKAIVHPIYKSGDRNSVSNYRPISVLSSLSKILEKILNNTLVNFLEKYHLISNNQYGFRRNKSCEDAVLALTTTAVRNIDRERKCIGIFLDLSKAFDTVSVPLLCNKMDHIGIREMNIFYDYLHGRSQCVNIDGHISENLNLNYGVPQGSILGPTLFQIYINDLCQLSLPNCNIFTYADDTALLIHGENWKDAKANAERCLRIIMDWLTQNLLTLNISKSQFIAFSLKNTKSHRRSMRNFTILAHTCTNQLLTVSAFH